MNKAESYLKMVKIMSIFFIVYDLLMIVLFSIMAAGLFDYDTATMLLDLPEDMLGGVSLASVVPTLGVMMAVSQVIHLIGVLFVYRGVRNPAKMKPGMIIFGIFSVLAVFGCISSVVSGSFSWTAWTQYIVTWFMFYDIVQVYKLAK